MELTKQQAISLDRWLRDHLISNTLSWTITSWLSTLPAGLPLSLGTWEFNDLTYRLDADGVTWFDDGDCSWNKSYLAPDNQEKLAKWICERVLSIAGLPVPKDAEPTVEKQSAVIDLGLWQENTIRYRLGETGVIEALYVQDGWKPSVICDKPELREWVAKRLLEIMGLPAPEPKQQEFIYLGEWSENGHEYRYAGTQLECMEKWSSTWKPIESAHGNLPAWLTSRLLAALHLPAQNPEFILEDDELAELWNDYEDIVGERNLRLHPVTGRWEVTNGGNCFLRGRDGLQGAIKAVKEAIAAS